jgi:UTP--glucose-1-phosphate uridylyltransferase
MSTSIQKLVLVLSQRSKAFFPLASVNPSELWLLGEQPFIQYLLDEAKEADLREVIIVGENKKKVVYSYLTASGKAEKGTLGQVISGWRSRYKDLSFQFLGSDHYPSTGEILLKLKSKLKSPWAMVKPRGLFLPSPSSFSQLEKVFQTSQKPVLGLVEDGFNDHWKIEAEKIAQRIFKISQLTPIKKKEKNSFLNFSGYYILTPEVISFLEELKKKGVKKENLELEEGLSLMRESGQPVYGYQLKGEWLPVNSKEDWLKANLYLTLSHSSLGENGREYLKAKHLC